MKLLIVEDETKTASFLKRGFNEAGFVVCVAADGHEGMQRVETSPFDLIVLDIMLPGMDGLQLLSWIRGRGLQTPVLVLTARDAVQDRVRGLELGADDRIIRACTNFPICVPVRGPWCIRLPASPTPATRKSSLRWARLAR